MTDDTTIDPDDCYIFIDDTGSSDYWLYSATYDTWSCFDPKHGDPWESDSSSFEGFDRGIRSLIKKFGIRPDALINDDAPTAALLGTLTHLTSKVHALNSKSTKLLTPEQNALLDDAGNGKEIDIYEFRKAATAALSAATTRAGNSGGRREYAKAARHLIYWADALIDNHAKGLPVYGAGERSPKIARLERDGEILRAEVSKLREENSALARAMESANDEITNLIEQKAVLAKDLGVSIERSAGLEDALRVAQEVSDDMGRVADKYKEEATVAYGDLRRAEKERDHWAAGVSYAIEQDDRFGQRILGYLDGIA